VVAVTVLVVEVGAVELAFVVVELRVVGAERTVVVERSVA
jgi:hypothetical protein